MTLPSWADQMNALAGVGDGLVARWRPEGASESETQDMYKLALSILSVWAVSRVLRRLPAVA